MVSQVASVDEAAILYSSSSHGRRNDDDAFWLCDIGDAAANLRKWSGVMPRVRPYYAVKAAPHRPLVKYLLLKGAGLDCATQGEIDLALSLGANPADIVLSNTNKQISHLKHARIRNVNLTVYDGEDELRKIKQYHPECEIMLRIKAFSSNVTIDLNTRFGASVTEGKRLIQISKELGMKMVGICFHVGSGCFDRTAYTRALQDSRELFDFAATLGYTFDKLDIGGGFHGIKEETASFHEFAKTINEGLASMFPEEDNPHLKVMAEPGKFFATATFTLVTNVIAKKESGSGGPVVYTVNDGVFGGLGLRTLGILGQGECEPRLLCEEKRRVRECRIDGPTCSGIDVICTKSLPEANIGDWMAWENCGSYTFAIASDFNNFGPRLFYDIVTHENRKLIDDGVLQQLKTCSYN